MSIDQLVVSEDGERLTTLVSVYDATGQPVLGLSAFETSIDGSPVEPESVRPVVDQGVGIAVLLLIDVSGSMQGEPLAQARSAAASFVDGLLPQDVAAVAPFAGGVTTDVPFTNDHGQLLATIGALAVEEGTGTALHDAVVASIDTIALAPTARRAVILLTDGKHSGTASAHTREDAVRAASAAGAPFFTIALGEDTDVAFLQELAEEASGSFYRAPAPADVPYIFETVGARLRSQYSLLLPLPPSAGASRELFVSINLEGTVVTTRATFQGPSTAVSTDDGGAGVSSIVVVGAVAAGMLGAALLALPLIRRRRRGKSAVPGGPGRQTSVSIRTVDALKPVAPPGARLLVVAGPNAGASVPLASGPVDIGSDSACDLQIDPVDGIVGGVHARAWLQSNRLMLHHLARGRETLVADKPVEWATLEPDDTLRIGPHLITFSLDV